MAAGFGLPQNSWVAHVKFTDRPVIETRIMRTGGVASLVKTGAPAVQVRGSSDRDNARINRPTSVQTLQTTVVPSSIQSTIQKRSYSILSLRGTATLLNLGVLGT